MLEALSGQRHRHRSQEQWIDSFIGTWWKWIHISSGYPDDCKKNIMQTLHLLKSEVFAWILYESLLFFLQFFFKPIMLETNTFDNLGHTIVWFNNLITLLTFILMHNALLWSQNSRRAVCLKFFFPLCTNQTLNLNIRRHNFNLTPQWQQRGLEFIEYFWG